jgi:hypothetical protein
MPVILATWEAEIGKTTVWDQPGQIIFWEQNRLEVSVWFKQVWSPEFKAQSHQKKKKGYLFLSCESSLHILDTSPQLYDL